jgi:hypothetical protein
MHMGHYCAINMHQDMLKHRYGQMPNYKELSKFPNVMGLAVGKKAVVYDSTNGTASGEELMKSYFGDDLANSSKRCHNATKPLNMLTQIIVCWNYMKLGQAVAV